MDLGARHGVGRHGHDTGSGDKRPPAVAVRGQYLGEDEVNKILANKIPTEQPSAEIGEFDFAGIIEPILKRSCMTCHGGDKPKSGFKLSGRKALLKGGESGEPAIRPGNGAESLLARVVADKVEDMEMPPLSKRKKFPALSEDEIHQITLWIDAGAPWPENSSVK